MAFNMFPYRSCNRPDGTVRLLVAIVLIALLVAPHTAFADQGGDFEAITALHGALVHNLRHDEGFAERKRRVLEAVRLHFHMLRIARTIVGAGWRQLDEEQRRELTSALADLIAATYAAQFHTDSGQEFVTLGAESIDDQRMVVRTELRRKDRDSISLIYHLSDGLIFNVVADGVSDLSLRRAQYGTIFRREGLDALLEQVRQQISERANAADD